jgi:hypothetical protein
MHIYYQFKKKKKKHLLQIEQVALHVSSKVLGGLDQDNIQGQISLGHA